MSEYLCFVLTNFLEETSNAYSTRRGGSAYGKKKNMYEV